MDREIQKMSDMKIYQEMKDSSQWDRRYFELEAEQEERNN